MKKSYILIFMLVMLTVTGCDFFRRVAGRPTSDVIEMKRLEMEWDLEEKAARERAYKDSLERVMKEQKDSVAACEYIANSGVSVIQPQKLGGIHSSNLESGYYIVLGSFKAQGNAKALYGKVKAAGDFSPVLIGFRNGMVAVAACHSEKVHGAVESLKRLKVQPFCPPDAWILKID